MYFSLIVIKYECFLSLCILWNPVGSFNESLSYCADYCLSAKLTPEKNWELFRGEIQ